MKTCKILVLVLMAACANAAAHNNMMHEVAVIDSLPDGDRLRSESISEVVVTGTRNETDIRHLPMTVSVVSRSAIESSMQTSLLPVITEHVPGLFTTARGVLGYGVSGGAAGGISMRGLSGGSGQLMVLIDGHPQYMGLMGHPISDSYQTVIAERVEVLRGPASVLYGSNAMGGVINIVTRKTDVPQVSTDVNLGYGSWNTLQSAVTNRVRKGRFSSVVSGFYNRTDGHRQDLDFQQYGGLAKVGYDISAAWNISADIDITHFDASNPGQTFAPIYDARQRVTRGVASVAASNNYKNTSGAVSAFYNWGRHWINDGHSAEATPLDYRFNSRDRMAGISVFQSASFFAGNRITAGVDIFHVAGQAWNDYVEGSRNGERSDIADRKLNEAAAYIDFRQHIGNWLTFDAGLRYDSNSHVGSAWIPQAGFSFHLPQAAELKLSASKGFRYPTIREMFMFPPQNPDLRPEQLWNYELSVSQRLLDGRLSWGANLFYIDGQNMIVLVPRQGATPQFMNTGRVRNTGLELETAFRITRSWSADANYSFLHMENPVISAPEHKLYVGVGFNRGAWQVSTGVQYINGLYTSTSPVVKENFVLWNIRGSYRVNSWLDVWVRGENLLGQQYEIMYGYPMPGVTVIGGLNLNF